MYRTEANVGNPHTDGCLPAVYPFNTCSGVVELVFVLLVSD